MTAPVEIAWHNMSAQPKVEARVNERAGRLLKLMDRITHVHVVIEAAHRRHRQGNAYEVRMDVGLPGGARLEVNRRPGDDDAHFDAMVAVRDAFNAMERQLKKWKQQHSGRPPVHAAPLQGRVEHFDAEANSGAIATVDGQLIYFHRNALVAGDFDKLQIGDPVELVIDPGEDADGPHASTVRPISKEAFGTEPG